MCTTPGGGPHGLDRSCGNDILYTAFPLKVLHVFTCVCQKCEPRRRRSHTVAVMAASAICALCYLWMSRFSPFTSTFDSKSSSSSPSAVPCPSLPLFRPLMSISPRTQAPYPTVLLYSFEGSGNTWMRLLLEDTTGVLTAQARPELRYAVFAV